MSARFSSSADGTGKVDLAQGDREGDWLRVLTGVCDLIFYSYDSRDGTIEWRGAEEHLGGRGGGPDFAPGLDRLVEQIHPDERETFHRQRREALRHHARICTLLRIRGRDGIFRTYHLRGARVPEAPYRLVGTLLDVSDCDLPGKVREDAERARLQQVATIERLNADLERRVADRTAQLLAANAELEAFSYSVSHDLRAPLRGIAGFSRALEEDYAAQLDDTGRDYLRRIQTGSKRMGALIDDLLNLARMSRGELRWQRIDLTALAQQIGAEIANHAGRAVEFIIAPGLAAQGDAELLRVALTNLIDNAWKYTRQRPDARVEFAQQPAPDEHGATVFFLRDNGAGFDMRYAGKLFGAFQRLHHVDDFEGTGIGLATVRRIIHRHGGRVWAEASPGAGACFYFTLPRSTTVS